MTENVCIFFFIIAIWLSLGILGIFQRLEDRRPWGMWLFLLCAPFLAFISYLL